MNKINTKILQGLRKNSPPPPEDIAITLEITEKEVETRSPVHGSFGILKKCILKKCTVVVNHSTAGYDDVTVILSIKVKVTPEKGLGCDGIAEKIACYPQVESIVHLTRVYNFQVIVHDQSMVDVSRFAAEQIVSIDDVYKIMAQIIMRTYKEQGVTMAKSLNKDHQLITF